MPGICVGPLWGTLGTVMTVIGKNKKHTVEARAHTCTCCTPAYRRRLSAEYSRRSQIRVHVLFLPLTSHLNQQMYHVCSHLGRRLVHGSRSRAAPNASVVQSLAVVVRQVSQLLCDVGTNKGGNFAEHLVAVEVATHPYMYRRVRTAFTAPHPRVKIVVVNGEVVVGRAVWPGYRVIGAALTHPAQPAGNVPVWVCFVRLHLVEVAQTARTRVG